jgi:hypothetical protein
MPIQQKDGPFTVKFLSAADKTLAVDAAARAKITVQDWIALAIRSTVASERESVHDEHGEILAPERRGSSALTILDPMPPMSIEDIGRAIEIGQTIAKLRGQDLKPNSKLLINAQRAVSRRLESQ